MSRRASRFKDTIVSPKTLSQFQVIIPLLAPETTWLVEAAMFPTESTGETSVWNKGSQMFFPTFSEVPGTWSCTIPEEQFVTNKISIDALRNIQAGDGRYVIMYSIFVYMTYGQSALPVPGTQIVLGNSFLLSVDPIYLDASKPEEVVKWKLTFRYNYIEPAFKGPY